MRPPPPASVAVLQAIAAIRHAGARELADIVALDAGELLVAIDVEIRAVDAGRARAEDVARGAILQDRGIVARALARNLDGFPPTVALVRGRLVGRVRRAIPIVRGLAGAAGERQHQDRNGCATHDGDPFSIARRGARAAASIRTRCSSSRPLSTEKI